MSNSPYTGGSKGEAVAPWWQFSTGIRQPQINPGGRGFSGNASGSRVLLGKFPGAGYTGEPFSVAVTMTIRLAAQDVNGAPQVDANTFDWGDASLHVECGSGIAGNDVAEFDCDLINGDSFPLVARGANFWLDYPIIELQGLVQPSIDVSLSFAPYCHGSSGVRAPRRTIKVGDIEGGGTSAIFPIPKMAVSAVLLTNDATTIATLNHKSSPVAGAATKLVSSIQKQEYQSVPLYRGARGFSVTNPSQAGGISSCMVMFYLATG